jgi:lyso-ornithine lipid O-acyltransferase
MRMLWAAPWAAAIIIWHIVSCWFFRLLVRDPIRQRRFFLARVSRHAGWMLKALDMELEVSGQENAILSQNYMIVANHMSYLDAVIIAAFRQGAFVTSMEMRAIPVLGLITELGGCLYVERRSKENIHNEISEIEEALKAGLNVIIFPEATSTDGSRVIPFKRPLFAAAAKAQIPVLPVVIEYQQIDGQPVTTSNRDLLCWYGKMGFAPHFLELSRHRRIRVRLQILPPVNAGPGATRDSLMDEAFLRISSHYQPIK